ncbi:MAG: flavodoxin [Clostridia bacterium]|nr:flavodoxin [Clostridia bacterium]
MKKLLSILVVLMMTLSLLTCAMAEEETETTVPEPTSHILIIYFSATGTTKTVAENLQTALNADIYEIVPEQPYTDADLNYNDRNSRTTHEQDDRTVRPAIAGELPDLTPWDTIFIGYPIWWGEEPRIMDTLVENLDLTDKTIAVFFTSGGSGLGNSMKHLEQNAGAGTWLQGKRFYTGTSVQELANWAKGLGIEP